MKPLDKTAIDIVRQERLKKTRYPEICSILFKHGYTAADGKVLHPAVVSAAMCKLGFRTKRPFKRGLPTDLIAGYSKPLVNAPASPDTENFMLDVIANKNLTREQKLKVLSALL